MKRKILTTPIQDEELESLTIGDIVYLNGYLVTSRDDVHQRLIKQHKSLPVNLAGLAIFHAGPIMQEIEGQPGKYRVISIGPTTSMRMEKYEKEFIAQTGLKLMVGKGGMGLIRLMDAGNIKRCILCFPAAVRFWPPTAWKRWNGWSGLI